MDELEDFEFGVGSGAAGHYYGDGAAVDYAVEVVLAPVGFDDFGAHFGADAAGHREVAGIALVEFAAHGGDGHNGDAVALALVDQFAEVEDGLLLVFGADEYGDAHGGGVETDGVLHRGG